MTPFPPIKLWRDGNLNFAIWSVFWLISLSATDANGQSVPEAINYQAIVRDTETLLPISDQAAYVSVEFINGPNGDVLYQEEFPFIQTGRMGLINLSLGNGNPVINSFGSISWESGNIWLRLSVDIGNGLNILQETPFNTVPYAFYASSAGTSNPDGDGDSTNELIEEIVLDGTNLLISEGDQTQTVELNSLKEDEDPDPFNEIQSLSLNGAALSISGVESTIDLTELPGLGNDGDSDSSNELQELELVENSLTISNSPNNTAVDLSPYMDNSDNQDLTLSGAILSLSGDATSVDLSDVPGIGADADADPMNEIQDLSLAGSTLSISSDDTPVDLSPYDQSDLSEGHIFIGNALNKVSEVEVSGDIVLDEAGETEVAAIRGTDVSPVPPTNGQVLAFNEAESEWQPQSASTVISAGDTKYYSIDPLDFRELTDNVIGVELDVNNALKFFDDDAPFAMLRDVGIIEIMAPIHLPHGSTINNLKVYFRDSGTEDIRFSLYRKDMTNYSVGNEILTTVLAEGPPGDKELDIDITNTNQVDNSIYSYRLYVRFTSLEGDDEADIDDVDQRVYGAVIEYATN